LPLRIYADMIKIIIERVAALICKINYFWGVRNDLHLLWYVLSGVLALTLSFKNNKLETCRLIFYRQTNASL